MEPRLRQSQRAVLRPGLEDAKVTGCKVSRTKGTRPGGAYRAKVGDLIELDYIYPAGAASGTPKEVDFTLTLLGTIGPSKLGIRR